MKLSFWDILASMVMLGGLALATIFINIFINPYSFINPFPPPTPVASLDVPTLTPSQRSLPDLWTATPETPGVPSVTAATTGSQTLTVTTTGTHYVLPSATATGTRTPVPTSTRTITRTPNRTLTSIAYKSATATSSSSDSSDTTKPSNPGTPYLNGSTTADSTPTWAWAASSDSGSGISLYQITWGTSSDCDNTVYTSTSNGWTLPSDDAVTVADYYYICVRAKDNAGNESSWIGPASFNFGGPNAPSATTNAATSVTNSSAILNGTVNPNGSATTVLIQYSLDYSFAGSLWVPGTLSGSSDQTVNMTASGLLSGRRYYFRVVASNAYATTYAAPLSFVTSSGLSQTISFTSAAPVAATVGGATYTPTATATSGLTVTFTSATTSICTISGGVVSFVGAGTCTINANQAGNATYSAAPQVQQSFTVAKATPTITFGAAPTPTYLGGNFSVIASTTNTDSSTLTYSVSSGPCSLVSGATFSTSGAGTCVILASGAATTNFNAASQTQNVTIAKATPAITFGAVPSATYGSDFNVSATTTNTDDNTITFSASSGPCTAAGGTTFTPSGAGTCVVQAAGAAETTNFLATTPQTQSVIIGKAASVITFGAAPSGTYLGGDFTVSATTTNTDDPTITFSVSSGPCSQSGSDTFTPTGAGTCVVQAAGAAATANFLATTPVTQNVTIAKATAVITFDAAPTPTHPTSFTVNATTTNTDSGTITYSLVSGPCTADGGASFTTTGTGTCRIQATGAATTNFTSASATQDVVIS